MPQQPLQIYIANAAKLPRRYEWGEVQQGYKIYACHQAQLDILSSKAKFTFAFAGSGAGKTCLIPLWLFKQIIRKPNGRYLIVSPNASTFDSSELKRHIQQTFEQTSYVGKWKTTLGTYKYILPSGGEIIIKTVGDGGEWQRLTGGQYHAAVADECYLLSAEVWEEIRRRVSNNNGQVLAVTTPTGNNWIYDIKQRAETGDKDYYIRHWSKTANPTVSLEDVERERALMSKARFERMVEGNFAAYEGLVFGCFSDPSDHERYPVIIGNPLIDGFPNATKPVRFFGGVDWGYKPDPAAILMIAECEDGAMYVVDEIYGTEINPDALARAAKALIDKWAISIDSKYAAFGGSFKTYYADVSRPEHVALFRQANIAIQNKKVTDILATIASTDSYFNSGRLKIYANCQNLIREMRGYQWTKDRTGGLKDSPLDKQNHTCFVGSTLVATDKGDIPIRDILVGDRVLTRAGYRRVTASMKTSDDAITYTLALSNGTRLTATGNHPLWVIGKGFIPLEQLKPGDSLLTNQTYQTIPKGAICHEAKLSFIKAFDTVVTPTAPLAAAETTIGGQRGEKVSLLTYIGIYGKPIMDPFRRAIIFITEMATSTTIRLTTTSYCQNRTTSAYTPIPPNDWRRQCGYYPWLRRQAANGIVVPKAEPTIADKIRLGGRLASLLKGYARNAGNLFKRGIIERQLCIAGVDVRHPLGEPAGLTYKPVNALYAAKPIASTNIALQEPVTVNVLGLCEDKRQSVFNISVEEQHEYFANGVLAKNCDALRYSISSHKYGEPMQRFTVKPLNETTEAAKAQAMQLMSNEGELKEIVAAALNKRKQQYNYWLAFGDLD